MPTVCGASPPGPHPSTRWVGPKDWNIDRAPRASGSPQYNFDTRNERGHRRLYDVLKNKTHNQNEPRMRPSVYDSIYGGLAGVSDSEPKIFHEWQPTNLYHRESLDKERLALCRRAAGGYAGLASHYAIDYGLRKDARKPAERVFEDKPDIDEAALARGARKTFKTDERRMNNRVEEAIKGKENQVREETERQIEAERRDLYGGGAGRKTWIEVDDTSKRIVTDEVGQLLREHTCKDTWKAPSRRMFPDERFFSQIKGTLVDIRDPDSFEPVGAVPRFMDGAGVACGYYLEKDTFRYPRTCHEEVNWRYNTRSNVPGLGSETFCAYQQELPGRTRASSEGAAARATYAGCATPAGMYRASSARSLAPSPRQLSNTYSNLGFDFDASFSLKDTSLLEECRVAQARAPGVRSVDYSPRSELVTTYAPQPSASGETVGHTRGHFRCTTVQPHPPFDSASSAAAQARYSSPRSCSRVARAVSAGRSRSQTPLGASSSTAQACSPRRSAAVSLTSASRGAPDRSPAPARRPTRAAPGASSATSAAPAASAAEAFGAARSRSRLPSSVPRTAEARSPRVASRSRPLSPARSTATQSHRRDPSRSPSRPRLEGRSRA
eukprot:TRINITY_DN26642_c0_g2_i1.p1 TRINITY_DN26642_c0_g2~~TRINITY_DN26642_c0_g2_i1.p1  ORF type:complete len:610 (+),score=91.81 TRINITY_DN26642_c0_g2_i1:124-1953(+)